MSGQKELDRVSAARLLAQSATSARERLQKLFDENTFVELDAFSKGGKSGVVTGYGKVDGATVFAFSQEVETRGAAVGAAQGVKIARIYDLAVEVGAPVVGIYDGKGGDIAEGNAMLRAYRDILSKANNLSGVVPQISLVLGACGGVSAMTACAADFLVISEKAELFLTPPASAKDKGVFGTAQSALRTGTAQILAANEDEAIDAARRLLAVLPENNLSTAASFDFTAPANSTVLDAFAARLDETSLCDIVKAIVDEGSFIRISSDFGEGAHTSLCTIAGYSVGMVNTRGTLNHDGAARIARFVSICDSFQIPVVTLINSEGFKPSGAEELSGAMRDMARLSHIYAEATTPKIAIVTGNGIGGAYVALSQADIALAWPGSVVSAMPVEAAVAFLKGSEISKEKTREMVEAEYRENEASALAAAAGGFVQDIIHPSQTREALINALDMLSGKRVSRLPKKHSNMPM